MTYSCFFPIIFFGLKKFNLKIPISSEDRAQESFTGKVLFISSAGTAMY